MARTAVVFPDPLPPATPTTIGFMHFPFHRAENGRAGARVQVPADVRAYAHAMIHTAALWDVLGAFGALPQWWPPVSYVMAAAGVAAASLAVLFDILGTRRLRSDPGAAPASTGRARTGGQLAAAGILLAAWLLRGDAEIPPDVPLVAAEVLAAIVYAVVAVRWRR